MSIPGIPPPNGGHFCDRWLLESGNSGRPHVATSQPSNFNGEKPSANVDQSVGQGKKEGEVLIKRAKLIEDVLAEAHLYRNSMGEWYDDTGKFR